MNPTVTACEECGKQCETRNVRMDVHVDPWQWNEDAYKEEFVTVSGCCNAKLKEVNAEDYHNAQNAPLGGRCSDCKDNAMFDYEDGVWFSECCGETPIGGHVS